MSSMLSSSDIKSTIQSIYLFIIFNLYTRTNKNKKILFEFYWIDFDTV